MDHSSISRSEVYPGRKVLFLLIFAFFVAVLHVSCLFYSNGCSACVAPGSASVASSYNDNIYAFTSLSATTILTADGSDDLGIGTINAAIPSPETSTSLKPLYNSKFHDNEHFVPANLKLKTLWTSKEWRMKVSSFIDIFSDLMRKDLLKPCMKALCIGAGQGHEVLALKEMGIYNSIGIDLVASPPLVMKGDMHSQPFRSDTFDFEFCNVFDHALFTSMLADEIDRTLKPGGCVVIHLMLQNRTQEAYRPNNLQDVSVLIALFRNFEVLHVGGIDAFGLDTEVIFKKPLPPKMSASAK